MSANPISCKATDKATAAAHAMIDVSLVFAYICSAAGRGPACLWAALGSMLCCAVLCCAARFGVGCMPAGQRGGKGSRSADWHGLVRWLGGAQSSTYRLLALA